MTRTDVAMNLGPGVQFVKFTMTTADLTAAATTQTIQLLADPGGNAVQAPGTTATTLNAQNFQIPAHAPILGVTITEDVQAASATATSLTCTLRMTGGTAFPYVLRYDDTVVNTIVTPNLFTSATAQTWEYNAIRKGVGVTGAIGLEVLMTSVTDNVNTMTAGQWSIYICYLDVSTASFTVSTPTTTIGGV
jgi:hypothetical protein